MFYSFELTDFPSIRSYYTVVRNTVWQITDSDHILIAVKDGECLISCDGENYTVKKGDIFYIPAGHNYTRKPVGTSMCTMVYIHFSCSVPPVQRDIDELVAETNGKKECLDFEILSGETNLSYPNTIYIQNKNTIKDTQRLESYLSGINLFSSKRQLMCGLQSSICLCSILALISQTTLDKILTDVNIRNTAIIPPNLKKAISYIAGHYSEQITLEELASYCNVSKQQLIRYFKSAFCTTPIKYITEFKIARAKELLFNHSQLTVKEIAAELGFDNQHYFTRVFYKTCRETPTQYRYRVLNYKEESGKD